MHKFKWNFDRSLLFAPDENGGSPPADDNPPADLPGTGNEPGKNDTGEAKFTQADLDRVVQERLDRERKKRETETEKARQEAERKALKEQEQFKTLTETQEKELGELRPKAELADTLTEYVTELINDEIKDWPAEVKAMAPSGEVSPIVMLTWMKNARPLAQKLAEKDMPQNGNGRKPKPVGPVRENREVTPVVNVKQLF